VLPAPGSRLVRSGALFGSLVVSYFEVVA